MAFFWERASEVEKGDWLGPQEPKRTTKAEKQKTRNCSQEREWRDRSTESIYKISFHR